MKFCFGVAVAKSLQVAQGPRRYGCFLFDVNVESKVFVNGEAKDFVS